MNLISEEWMVVEAEKKRLRITTESSIVFIGCLSCRIPDKGWFEIRMPVAASTCRNPVVPVYFALCALYIF